MYFPKPSINENDLAIIERGDTAAHSISAGQYVSWRGKVGKAKDAILQGATLESSLFNYDEDGAINSLSDDIIVDGVLLTNSAELPSSGVVAVQVAVTKTGYHPIGIVGITASGTGASYVVPGRFRILNGTDAYVAVWNMSSTARTGVTIVADILWKKN